MIRRQRNDLLQRKQTRKRVLRLEVLSDRVVLDGAGLGVADPLPWFDPGALTYSFAPDGTNVAGEGSQLFAQLDQLSATSAWQSQFDAAFNAWLAPLGATTQVVPDSGGRFGIASRTQGDSRFGDVRIAAIPLSRNVLATSVPHSAMVQGSWAGDILINANAQWNDLQEVFSVALHEYGHVLGLPHSDDPTSPMFVHGVHDSVAPTAADIERLRDLYVGIDFEDPEDEADRNSDPESESIGPGDSNDDDDAVTSFVAADLTTAIPLVPATGSTIRYSAKAIVKDSIQPIVYRLDPTSLQAEDLENLHVSWQVSGATRLDADIMVVDSAGRLVESFELHHGQGSVILQAQGVDSREIHYIVVTPFGLTGSQVGDFEIFMDYGPELRLSRGVGEITLDKEHGALDQSFSVASSRLVHIHLNSPGDANHQASVLTQLLDSAGNALTQFAMRPGTSRSAPLTFLSPGDYTLRFIAGSQADVPVDEIRVDVYIDEVSIDVGPGVGDPTGTPYQACDEPDADPTYCYEYAPIIPDPPSDPDPMPGPGSSDYPWWYDYGFSCSDYTGDDLEFAQYDDPLWWEFYVEACQATPTTPAPTTPAPTTPTPTTPTPTTPTPAEPDVSTWQNPQNKFDVTGNDLVTAQDALIIINLLGRNLDETIRVTDAATDIFADVNGDLVVTAADALMVINALARAKVAVEAELTSGIFTSSGAVNTAIDAERDEASDTAIGLLF